MSNTGKATLSIKRKDVRDQKSIATGFKKLVFAHQAGAGETTIDLAALTVPPDMAGNGFVNPSLADMQAAKMKTFRKNLTLISSLRGELIDFLSYTVNSATSITLFFDAEADEIFTGTLDHNAKTGVSLADAKPLVAVGDLAVGTTDFATGDSFKTGVDPQEVVVYRGGLIQIRNTGNSSTVLDGNYHEVDSGSGFSTLIRFNVAASGTPDSIIVNGVGALVERPTGSQQQEIDSLAGQIDNMIPTLADLANVPETDFQAAPNNIDLKQFGDRVLTNEQDIETNEQDIATIIGQTVASTSGSFDIGDLRMQWGSFTQVSAGSKLVDLTSSYADTSFKVFMQVTNQIGWTARAANTTVSSFTSTTGVGGTPNVSFFTIGRKA